MGMNDLLAIAANASSGPSTWKIISSVLAIVGGILVVTLFLTKGTKKNLKGFMVKLYDFFNFDLLTAEYLLKGLYAGLTIYIVLSSFELISVDFGLFVEKLILGVLFVRLLFEFFILFYKMYRNSEEIKNKLK